MSKYFLTSFFFFLFVINNYAQEKSAFRPSIAGHATFNSEDLMLGGDLGICHKPSNIRLSGLFLFRPFKRKTLVKQSSNSYIRYKEKRYLIGPTLSKHFALTDNFGVSLNSGILYTFANFAGSDVIPEKKWIPMLGGGLDFNISELILRVSYNHMPVPSINNNVIGISFIL